MYEFQDLTTISGHFRTKFEISGVSGQRPSLYGSFKYSHHYISNHTCIIIRTINSRKETAWCSMFTFSLHPKALWLLNTFTA